MESVFNVKGVYNSEKKRCNAESNKKHVCVLLDEAHYKLRRLFRYVQGLNFEQKEMILENEDLETAFNDINLQLLEINEHLETAIKKCKIKRKELSEF